MSNPVLSERTSSRVVVGFSSGEEQQGVLVSFSPYASHFTLQPKDATAGTGRRQAGGKIVTKDVAYIGFLKTEGPGPSSAARLQRRFLRAHLEGGQVFSVRAFPSEASNPVGFYGTPVSNDAPYDRIFFFTHAIRKMESGDNIGSLLLEEGLITQEDLNRGLQVQEDERKKPLGQILIEQQGVHPDIIDEAVTRQRRKRVRLGEILVETGLVSADKVQAALESQGKKRGKRLGELLVDMGALSEVELAMVLAKKFHLPFVDLDDYTIDPAAAEVVPADLIEKHGVLPVAVDDRSITLAVADPLATEGPDVVNFVTGKRVREVVVTPNQLQAYLRRFRVHGDLSTALPGYSGHGVDEVLEQLDEEEESSESVGAADGHEVSDADRGIVRLVNQIVIDSVLRGVSDIHIEPNGPKDKTRIRFRVDGSCSVYQEIPSLYWRPLVSRLKIMAGLDIAERRKPQDGKIKFRMRDREIELRVATMPTVNGNEDVVLRVLASSEPIPLDKLGLSERNLGELQRLAGSPYGLILVVGPTGSGKTTTLHAVLGSINSVDRKIWTAEDPVEITQRGLRQVQVNAKIGFDFAAALRTFLRADPDVIMVGEMRDHETAHIGVESALTGHLVLSTLHTNSAPETVTRLLDMGIEPFTFADSLLGVLAQRLARALCPSCREEYTASDGEVQRLMGAYGEEAFRKRLGDLLGAALKLWRGKGCGECGQTGYRGRVALHELLVADNEEVQRVVQQRAPAADIRALAREQGMTTLLQDGVEKALQGRTDMNQVLAVCSR